MKALIKVGYACNENCSFCHTLDIRHIDGPTEEIDAKIHRAAFLGHSMVVLSGGEPTIRPELLHWAKLTASLGLDFGLVTNGQMLAYPDVVEKLLEQRLRYVYLSLHGGSAKVHNLMVRSNGYDHAMAALRNLTGRGIDLSVNCVITKHNVDHLVGLVDTLLPFEDLQIKFSMVEPKGGGNQLFRHLMPSVTHVANQVRAAIAHGQAKAGRNGPRFAHGAIPLCLLSGLEHLYDDLKTHQYRTMIEVGENDFFPVDDLNKQQPPACDGCALRGPCPGLYRGYYEAFGDEELVPVRNRPRANSYNYTLADVREAPSQDSCPLKQDLGITPWERGRSLFVRNGGKLARFRAHTRDFSDEELHTIKHDLGQVYYDVSRKPAPTDFARDLVKLQRSALCTDCEHRSGCTGLFEPQLEDVFTRDDQFVRSTIANLRGRVLDIGCGEGPYEELWAQQVQDGAVAYTGIDPEPELVQALAAKWPWATLHPLTAEELSPEQFGTFDHVLILRSWNHLHDPATALRQVLQMLSPGGIVTIVDNVAFGLARTRNQTTRAEHSRARHEHYRNDRAADACEVLDGVSQGFDVEYLARTEVGPSTSNQWIVQARIGPKPRT
ncbi:MAG: radical SAM protein [Nannocystaceae bacterium]